MSKARHSVGAIYVQGEKVLLVTNTLKSGYAEEIYGLPAGRFENEEESEKHAVVREFCEETGMTTSEADIEEFPNNFYSAVLARKEGLVEYSIRFFRVKKAEGQLKNSDETEPLWVAIADLDKLKLVPNVKIAILESLK